MLRVKELCKSKGITQKKLAETMKITPESLSQMLKKGNPTLSSLESIAKALDVPIFKLLENNDTEKRVKGYLEIGNKIYRISNMKDLQVLCDKLRMF